jgi:Arylsulfotransferase (ASST)/Secretion system C-terminal sorting domain
MNRLIFGLGMLLVSYAGVNAQQWGNYTLYSTGNSTTATLIDTASAVYHQWTGLSGQTAYSNYMLPGGVLLRTVKTTNSTFSGGGMAGRVQKVDYNGTLLWDYTYSTSTYCSHHDICALPNGNVMLIAYESKSSSQATAAGSNYAGTLWPDHIVEVQPTGTSTGTIVWEWHLWDHLCQSVNSNAANYVTNTADHPELYNINAVTITSQTKDFWHMNGIDYNPMTDQIVVSAHNTNEFYVIDHSTTTAEAAGHTGGRGGRGGDFLYRWGNPALYGQSGSANFNVLHDAHWIPQDCPNAGYIVALNNKGISNTQSCVDMVNPPVSGFNFSYTPNTAWLPSTYTIRQNCTGGTTNMGNSQQLPNGNMQICLALSGTIYEINSAGTTLWSFTASGSVAQAFRYSACQITSAAPAIPTITSNGNVLTASSATTYQWYVDGVLIPGATSQTYTATQSGAYVVRVTDSNGCWFSYSSLFDHSVITDIASFDNSFRFTVYPNPSNGIINLSSEILPGTNFSVQVLDSRGRLVANEKNNMILDLTHLENGVYFMNVYPEIGGVFTERIIISK